MSRPVTVSEAQDQLLETAFELYRIMQRLHHQHEGLKAEYEPVREFYDAEDTPTEDGPRSLELEVAEQTDMAVDTMRLPYSMISSLASFRAVEPGQPLRTSPRSC